MTNSREGRPFARAAARYFALAAEGRDEEPEALALRDELNAMTDDFLAARADYENESDRIAPERIAPDSTEADELPAEADATANDDANPAISRADQVARWMGQRRGRKPKFSDFHKGQVVALMALGVPARTAASLLSIDRSTVRRAFQTEDRMLDSLRTLAARVESISGSETLVGRNSDAER